MQRRRNGDERLQELRRAILADGLRDPALLEELARELRRRPGGQPRALEAEAIARDSYWADVRAIAKIVDDRNAARSLLQIVNNQVVTWNALFGALHLGPCSSCGAPMRARGIPRRTECRTCAGEPDDPYVWDFLEDAVLATGRFDGFSGLAQIAAQCFSWAEGRLPAGSEGWTQRQLTPDFGLRWFLTDIANEADRLRIARSGHCSLPRHGERVLVLGRGATGTSVVPDAEFYLPPNATGTVVYARCHFRLGPPASPAIATVEIFVRLDQFALDANGSFTTSRLPEPVLLHWEDLETFRRETRRIA